MPRNFVIVVLDSCRYDSLVAAETPNIDRLGKIERRCSYATWTAPSHFNLLMGLLPHANPQGVEASGHYKRDLLRYRERLGADRPDFRQMVSSMYMPVWLQRCFGYRTHALVSLPVLWPRGPLNRGFDRFELMPVHNDFEAIIPRLEFDASAPSFYLLNVGETHYPYCPPGDETGRWPHLRGVRGVFRDIDEIRVDQPHRFDRDAMRALHRKQVEMAAYCDSVLGGLFKVLPEDTWVVVTADHGECFGEDGHFGHGPVMHRKVFEVPLVEGVVPQ